MITKESVVLRKHVRGHIKSGSEETVQIFIDSIVSNGAFDGRVNESSIAAKAQALQDAYPGLELLRDDDTDLYKLGLKSCLAIAIICDPIFGTDPCTIDEMIDGLDYEIDWGTPEEKELYRVAYTESKRQNRGKNLRLNISWFKNHDPEQGLNPLLKYVNSNSDEENMALLEWAGNQVGLADLDNWSISELKKRRKIERAAFKRVLAGNNDLETDGTTLVGYGTLAENNFYYKTVHKQIENYRQKHAKEIAYEEECRDAERRAELIEAGLDPDCPWRSV